MSLATERELKQSHSEHKSYPVVGNRMSECSFSIDKSGYCSAQFHGVHVDKIPTRPTQNGRSAALQKYAFVFRTAVNVCGCQIPLEVLKRVS